MSLIKEERGGGRVTLLGKDGVEFASCLESVIWRMRLVRWKATSTPARARAGACWWRSVERRMVDSGERRRSWRSVAEPVQRGVSARRARMESTMGCGGGGAVRASCQAWGVQPMKAGRAPRRDAERREQRAPRIWE